MKTKEDLNALIPTIINLLSNEEHKIGDYEEGEYIENSFYYNEDGWEIVIDYSCTGRWFYERATYYTPGCCDLESGWGEVDVITANHWDRETGDEIEFDDEDLNELYDAVNDYLECIE